MGQPAVGKPELLVEHLRVHNECVSFPPASCVAIVQRIVRVSASLTRLRTAIRINEMPKAIPATFNQKNTPKVFVLEKRNAIRHLKLAYCAGRLAINK